MRRSPGVDARASAAARVEDLPARRRPSARSAELCSVDCPSRRSSWVPCAPQRQACGPARESFAAPCARPGSRSARLRPARESLSAAARPGSQGLARARLRPAPAPGPGVVVCRGPARESGLGPARPGESGLGRAWASQGLGRAWRQGLAWTQPGCRAVPPPPPPASVRLASGTASAIETGPGRHTGLLTACLRR